MLIALKYCRLNGQSFRTGQEVPADILPEKRISSLILQGFLMEKAGTEKVSKAKKKT